MLKMRHAEEVKVSRALARFTEVHGAKEEALEALTRATSGTALGSSQDAVLAGLHARCEAMKPGVEEAIEEVRLLNSELLEAQVAWMESRKEARNARRDAIRRGDAEVSKLGLDEAIIQSSEAQESLEVEIRGAKELLEAQMAAVQAADVHRGEEDAVREGNTAVCEAQQVLLQHKMAVKMGQVKTVEEQESYKAKKVELESVVEKEEEKLAQARAKLTH